MRARDMAPAFAAFAAAGVFAAGAPEDVVKLTEARRRRPRASARKSLV